MARPAWLVLIPTLMAALLVGGARPTPAQVAAAPTPDRPAAAARPPDPGDPPADEAAGGPAPAPTPGDPRAAARPDAEARPSNALDVVMVTATRVAERQFDVPQTTSVATAEELARRQAATPALMLRDEPGVWVQRTGTGGGSPILRGQIGYRVLYLWDGVRINNAALFGGPNNFFNQILPGSIERIEVIRGPGSVQYGSDGVGGVVQILTRRVEALPESGVAWGGSSQLRVGSADDLVSETAYAWAASPQVSVVAGGGFLNTQDYRGGGDAGRLNDTDFGGHGAFVKAAFRPSRHHRFELSFQRMEREDVHTYTQSRINPSTIPTLFTPNEERELTKLTYEGAALCSWLERVEAYGYCQEYDARSLRTTETTTRFDRRSTDTDQTMYGGGGQAVLPFHLLGDHRLLVGGDYRREQLDSEVKLLSISKTTGAATTSIPNGNTPDGSYEVWDGFLSLELQPVEPVTVTFGARYEVSHLDSNPTPLDLVSPYTLSDIDVDAWLHAVTWHAGSVWWITDEVSLAADVATGFRAPTYSDLLSFSVGTASTATSSIPSPGVGPERSTHYELGPRYAGERVSAAAAFFYTDLDDQVLSTDAGTILVPGVGVRRAQRNSNEGHGLVRGFELEASWEPIDRLTLFGNVSYTFAHDTKRSAPATFSPPLFGLVGARWDAPGDPSHPWYIEAEVRMTGDYHRVSPANLTDAGFAEDPGLGSPNTTTNPPLRDDFHLPGYAIVNLRAGVQLFEAGRTRGNFTLSVENLFDREYRETFSRILVDPGANVVMGLEIKY